MDKDFAQGSAKNKPRITLIRDTPRRLDLNTRLNEGVFNSVQFGDLVVCPIAIFRSLTDEWQNVRRHMIPLPVAAYPALELVALARTRAGRLVDIEENAVGNGVIKLEHSLHELFGRDAKGIGPQLITIGGNPTSARFKLRYKRVVIRSYKLC
jgi:hypothetical protein